MRNLFYPDFLKMHLQLKETLIDGISTIREKINTLNKDNPDVSVIIPAFNEEENILMTLSSLSASKTNKSVEILVVDNNSTDRTAELVKEAGAVYVFERKQGAMHARNAGLAAASGKYIINADGDSIYSPDWIELMTTPLVQEDIVLVYGRFSFIPSRGTSRFVYFLYESLADVSRWKNKYFGEEAVNVYGCSSAYKKEDALQVDGYNHPPDATEDGYLGLKLRNHFNKKLLLQKDNRTIVWTNDRRLYDDGSLINAFIKRVIK